VLCFRLNQRGGQIFDTDKFREWVVPPVLFALLIAAEVIIQQ